MAYDCVVCVKQVPDTANITGQAMRDDGTVNRGALPAVFNPEDVHALEAALEVRDGYGGTVTAVSMGPLNAAEVLRECLYRGADRGILINDPRAAASDTLATSYILSRAIKHLGSCDLVFCGRQAIDGDTAQVGPQLAEKLGMAQVTYFERFEKLGDGTARVRRNLGHGWEVLEARLPLLLTVLGAANVPRPAAARRVMRFKRARTVDEITRELAGGTEGGDDRPIDAEREKRRTSLKVRGLLLEQWDLGEIEADLQWCGLSGSPTKVHRVQSIVLTKEGHTEIPPTAEGVRRMIHELIEDHTL